MKQNRPILILGMHRSGTSLVAELVDCWGAYGGKGMGEQIKSYDNPKGYWEYLPLVRLNDELLAALGASWYLPPGDGNAIRALAADKIFRTKALRLIEEMNDSQRVWYWKDPRMPLLLPFWQEFLSEPVIIVPLRNPVNIIASLQKRGRYFDASGPEFFPASAILLLWQYTLLQIFSYTDNIQNSFFLDYEQLVASPEIMCRELSEFLASHTAGHPEGSLSRMIAAVNPKYFRNANTQTLNSFPVATQAQKALSEFAFKKISTPSLTFDPARFPLYPGWNEYLQTLHTPLIYNTSTQNNRLRAQLYIDTGLNFSEGQSIVLPIQGSEEKLEFSLKNYSPVTALRFDPVSTQTIVKVISAIVTDEEGKRVDVFLEQSNAYLCEEQVYYFDSEDPQITFRLPLLTAPPIALSLHVHFEAFGDNAVRRILHKQEQEIIQRKSLLDTKNDQVKKLSLSLREKEKQCLSFEDELTAIRSALHGRDQNLLLAKEEIARIHHSWSWRIGRCLIVPLEFLLRLFVPSYREDSGSRHRRELRP